MTSKKNIKKLVRESNASVDPALDQDILNHALGHLQERTQHKWVGLGPILWRYVMKQSRVKLSLAVLLFMVVMLGIGFFGDNSSRVWAHVLENVRNTNSFKWHSKSSYTEIAPDGKKISHEGEQNHYISEELGLFTEYFSNGALVFREYKSFESYEITRLNVPDKTYTRAWLREPRREVLKDLEWLDPKKMLIRVLESDYIQLGQKSFGGRALEGIETRDPAVLERGEGWLQLWIDPKTKLPVRIQSKMIRKDKGTEHHYHTTSEQLERNVVYSPGMFQPSIPSDYTRVEFRSLLRILERHASEGLRLCALGNDGTLPARLDKATVLEYIKSTDMAAIRNEQSYYEDADDAFLSELICDTYRFYNELLSQGKRVVYYGGQAVDAYGPVGPYFTAARETVLMYWNNSDNDYKVVRADLRFFGRGSRTETLTSAQLAQCLFETRGVACLSDFEGAQVYWDELALDNMSPVTIRVLDERTGLPMKKIELTVEAKVTGLAPVSGGKTNRFGQGNYLLPYGEYNVVAAGWEDGQRREQRKMIGVSGERKYLDVELRVPVFPQIKGRLVYANGRAVPQAWIRIGNSSCHSDDQGSFAMHALYGDPQAYHLGYVTKGNHTRCTFFWRMADQKDDWVLRLDWPSRISGRVVDQNGVPQSQAELELYAHPEGVTDKAWKLNRRTNIDDEGRFVFESVPTGAPVELRVAQPNSPVADLRIAIGELVPDHNHELGNIVLTSPTTRE
jgi:hypothetical protein